MAFFALFFAVHVGIPEVIPRGLPKKEALGMKITLTPHTHWCARGIAYYTYYIILGINTYSIIG